VHDSFYWGDHGSNSHTMSTIDCGDRGPNFVDGCEIFNGGLGVGTKGAVRELVVTGCHIYDQVNGIVISGERSSGPGAGKVDRGHYLIRHNRISDCARGIWIRSGKTHENRVWGNLIERCGTGFSMRNVGAVPDRPHLANNLFRSNQVAVYMVAGRDGIEKISTFLQSGFISNNNLFFANKVDWQRKCFQLICERSTEGLSRLGRNFLVFTRANYVDAGKAVPHRTPKCQGRRARNRP